MKIHLVALALAAVAFAPAARAADNPTVYRCGSTYQQAPCAGGKAIATDDSRSPAQVAAAREVAAHNRQQAEMLVRDRERQEAAALPFMATGIGVRSVAPARVVALPKAAKSKSTKAGKSGRTGDFVATVPGSGKKRSAKTT
jgi:hypothetical protein